MTRPPASLSLDLDNKWSYLKTHGDRGWESFPSYLDAVVPRFLRVLAGLDLRITVFVVGQDAALAVNRNALASIPSAGHEIGNHSYRHEPWLHLYAAQEVADELAAAEEAIEEATGQTPVGFRGPGFSLSPAVVVALIQRGYLYDASTLPTYLGPLARAYYFLTAKLTPEERRQRGRLFGSWSEGMRPVRPYWWTWTAQDAGGVVQGPGESAGEPRRLLEIPVTTLPVVRTPIHVSYLLFLRQFSSALAWSYWSLAMRGCEMAGIAPSLLLHPLDFLGGDDEPDLSFFPAMRMHGADKVAFVTAILEDFARRFEVMTLREYAAAVRKQKSLRQLPIAGLAGQMPRESNRAVLAGAAATEVTSP